MVPMPRKGLYVGTKDFIISNPNEKTILTSKISLYQSRKSRTAQQTDGAKFGRQRISPPPSSVERFLIRYILENSTSANRTGVGIGCAN